MIFYTAIPTPTFPSGCNTNTPLSTRTISTRLSSATSRGSAEVSGVVNALHRIHKMEIEYASINTINSQENI